MPAVRVEGAGATLPYTGILRERDLFKETRVQASDDRGDISSSNQLVFKRREDVVIIHF